MFSEQPADLMKTQEQEKLASLLPLLTEAIGNAFSIKKDSLHHYAVRKAVHALCKTLNINLDTAVSLLMSPPPYSEQVVSILAEHITIGETYFFRHSEQFEFLEKTWLPALIEEREGSGEKKITIWSAGCSTGEEPYSLAILLNKVLPDFSTWDITIFATDINQNSLAFARQAVYSEWSFRSVSPAIIDKYFTKQTSPLRELTNILSGTRYRLNDSIRNMISFRPFNLTASPWTGLLGFPTAFDLILCRNVLMYFTREKAREIIGRFHTLLKDDGLFMVSPSEAWFARGTGFNLYPETHLSIFRKRLGIDAEEPYISHKPLLKVTQPTKPLSEGKATSTASLRGTRVSAEAAGHDKKAHGPDSSAVQTLQKSPMQQKLSASPPISSVPQPSQIANNTIPTSPAETARALADKGMLPEALAMLDTAIASDTTHAENHYYKALILMSMNKMSEAEISLKKAIFLDADMIAAYLALASLSQASNNQAAMLRHYRTALKLLAKLDENEIVPYSDGIPAKALAAMISKVTERHDSEETL